MTQPCRRLGVGPGIERGGGDEGDIAVRNAMLDGTAEDAEGAAADLVAASAKLSHHSVVVGRPCA